MKLNTDPWWWQKVPPMNPPQQPLPATTDVVVVGGGYTGLSAALLLARAGLSVHLFDANTLGTAASTRNAGMATGNLRQSFEALSTKFGQEKAIALYQESNEARRSLDNFIHEETIDCDYVRCGKFHGAVTARHFTRMQREVDLLNKHTDTVCYMVDPDMTHAEVGSSFYRGGMVMPDVASLDPAMYYRSLLQLAVIAGVVVNGQTPVSSVERDQTWYRVQTGFGEIQAQHVIMATNGYTEARFEWLAQRVIPAASHMIATEELSEDQMRRLIPCLRMITDSHRISNYYRPSPDGKRLLFGSRANGKLDNHAKLVAHTRDRMLAIFPELAHSRIDHSWWGYIALTFDQLPKISTHEGITYAAGYCGSGVVWAHWLGRKAAWRVLDDPRAKSEFDSIEFETRPFYKGKPWFLPAAIDWQHKRDRQEQFFK